ncbi:MAG: alcohol dehydrogenase catalytic domain-containing protein, partial [Halanaerobiaceae bacterium]|nr:alcohol dehydrogenase catalytic domain-containing protein [Halanaerobiaceae bacterium]
AVDSIGICGSDPHMHHNNVSYPVEVPLILGHEFSGIIAKTGSRVEKFKTGDRVTAETHAEYCGKCLLCRTNDYRLCRDRKGYGFGVDGAYAEYVKVPERILHRVPDNVSLEEAALTEPLCVAYNVVVEKMKVKPGDVAVVIGPGPIGILACKMLELSGASEIIVIGTGGDEKRLEMAGKYGATMIINSDNTDPVPIVLEKNEGYGADVVVDAAGPAATLKLSLELVRPSGIINKVAWGPEPVDFSLDKLISKAVTLQGSFSHTWDIWEKCLKVMEEGQVNLADLITHRLSLEDWEKGFELVESREGIKVVLKPNIGK